MHRNKRKFQVLILALGWWVVFASWVLTNANGISTPTIPAPGFQPSGLAYDGTFLFVSELSGFRTIFKLDPITGAVLGSFPAPSPSGFDGRGNPNDLVSDGAGRLFVSDIGGFGAGIVYEIDSAGTTILKSFSLPFRGGAIAFDGTNLYIGDFDSDRVIVTDRSGTFIRTFASGLRSAGMVFDPQRGHLWVISPFDNKVFETTTNGGLIRSCDGPRNPGVQGLGAVTMVGSRLYIAEVSDPDPFTPPNIPGTIFIVDPTSLPCNPPIRANQPPVANAGPDQAVIVGESVRFDGTGSSDPDGTIASFHWEFGDGGTADGAILGHVYTTAGQFTATLTVTDNDNATATDTAVVTVQTPAQAIGSLAALVASFNFQQGITNSLHAKVQNALDALNAANAGNRQDASNKLMAFINAVNAQRGKAITAAQADALVALAMRILAVL